MPKGIELPVNILVVIAIAVIVLLAMVALFMGGFKPAAGISAEGAFTDACRQVIYRCSSITESDMKKINVDYDVGSDADSTNNNLFELCKDLGKGTDVVSCRKACGCAQ